MRARRGGVLLPEPIEHKGQKVRGDSHPRVGNPDHQRSIVHPFSGHADRAALRRELDRIGEQVPDDLLHAGCVAEQRLIGVRQRRIDRDALRISGRTDRVHGRVDDAADGDGAQVEAQLPGNDPGNIEEVLDQLRLQPGVAFDDLDRLPRCLRIEIPARQQTRPAQDGI